MTEGRTGRAARRVQRVGQRPGEGRAGQGHGRDATHDVGEGQASWPSVPAAPPSRCLCFPFCQSVTAGWGGSDVPLSCPRLHVPGPCDPLHGEGWSVQTLAHVPCRPGLSCRHRHPLRVPFAPHTWVPPRPADRPTAPTVGQAAAGVGTQQRPRDGSRLRGADVRVVGVVRDAQEEHANGGVGRTVSFRGEMRPLERGLLGVGWQFPGGVTKAPIEAWHRAQAWGQTGEGECRVGAGAPVVNSDTGKGPKVGVCPASVRSPEDGGGWGRETGAACGGPRVHVRTAALRGWQPCLL